MGDSGGCGTDPCTWFDEIYARDACMSYLQCASPQDPRVIGLLPAVGNVLGSIAGQAVGGFTSSLGTATGLTNSTTNALWAAGLAAGALVLVLVLRR